MKSSYTGPATVFRHEHNGKAFYSVAEVKENMDGKKEYGYKTVQFRRGVDVADRSKISIKSAWESFYKTKDDEVVFYIFINDFVLQEGSAKQPEFKEEPKQQEVPTDFEQIDEDVPF